MSQICSRCVMDTTDPDIAFDRDGVCNHCHHYDWNLAARTLTGAAAAAHVDQLFHQIRAAGRGREYDCIIGVSGGVDSTFVAYKARELGLRPLAVHLDNGWNSELAVKNIEHVLNKLGIDLYTHVIDWDEFRDLQLAFLKASTPDAEIPTDHAILALLFQLARRNRVRYVLSGVNARTESHLPRAWSTGHLDWKYVRSIHCQFGTRKLTTFPHQSLCTLALNCLRTQCIDILNYLDYSKAEALQTLTQELGWKYYGGKHYESIYTRFYQGYYLPRKFGFDKRRSHLSSLICGGEITREQALRELAQEPYPEELQRQDREYVIKKFGLTDAEFQAIMAAPPKRFCDYPSSTNGALFRALRYGYRRFRLRIAATNAPQEKDRLGEPPQERQRAA
ncbi:MAG: N-acetyl sugar amidotransferase [Planctomycetes bacterium]|nr:N-acetyl sugar amidotransferase [Planctomycetota bacterium]